MFLASKHKLKAFSLFVLLSSTAFFFERCSADVAGLEEGTWRAILKTESGAEIPFNFSVRTESDKKVIYILNADERFRVDQIALRDDSINIQLPLFDSEIKARFEESGLRGHWVRYLPDRDISMEIEARPNTPWRFFKSEKEASTDMSGRWSVTFVSEDGKDTTLAVGEFRQDSSKVTGSFLTTTGDFRYLEGTLSKDQLFLSTFDGSHAYLFTGRVDSNTIEDGKFYAGLSTVRTWSARRDPNAMLPDAYSLTTLKPGYNKLEFSFNDVQGNPVSLNDERFRNKVVVVQFLGSWCPNCMDETAFLADFHERYQTKGVEVIGLAYERTNDLERSKKSVKGLVDRFGVKYPVLLTGYTNKEVMKSMPALNEFKAFPTTILIDKRGKVRRIHTGFSGPGTGEHYQQFVQGFEREINNLLNE